MLNKDGEPSTEVPSSHQHARTPEQPCTPSLNSNTDLNETSETTADTSGKACTPENSSGDMMTLVAKIVSPKENPSVEKTTCSNNNEDAEKEKKSPTALATDLKNGIGEECKTDMCESVVNSNTIITEISSVMAAPQPLIEISDDGSWDTKHQHEVEVLEHIGNQEAPGVSNQGAADSCTLDVADCHSLEAADSHSMEATDSPILEVADSCTKEMADSHTQKAANSCILEAVAELRDGLQALDGARPRVRRTPKDVVYDSILENKNKTKTYWEQRMLCVVEGESAPKVVDAVAKSPAVAKIALELREMREREEELRRARLSLQLPLNDSCSEYGSEDSTVSPPGYTHQRTDSMSSGHSSGSDFGRRRVTVKPSDDPDSESETPVYKRTQKETPIEKEIRLAREREEELRREKGLPPLNANIAPKSDFRFIHKTLHSHEQQNMQTPQPATNRIQQEIDEATQRERELKQSNGIKVPEESNTFKMFETPDAIKHFSEDKGDDLNNVSHTNISEQFNDGNISGQSVSTPRPQLAGSAQTNSSFTSPTQRLSGSGGQKGLMQRFYASHGRIKIVSATRNVAPIVVPPSVSPVFNQPVIQRKVLDISTGTDSQDSDEETIRTPVRRGYQSAEEKIQAELQEMQKREEELRLQRAKLFAQSQPNLLSIGCIEEEIQQINGDREKQTLQSAQSNPNLLDSDDSLDISQEYALQKFQKNSPRKRSALIAEWESRIQKNLEH